MSSPNKKLADCSVNNDSVINELTKDLETQLRSSDESPSSSQDDDKSSSFVIEPAPNDDADKGPANNVLFDVCDFDKDERSSGDENDDDDDEQMELKLKDMELNLDDDERKKRRDQAETLKNNGNSNFKLAEHDIAIKEYTKGLRICPLAYSEDRAILYSNRAASKMKLGNHKEAIKDCSKSIELNPVYVKAYFRRAQCHELVDALEDSMADYKKIIELEPTHQDAGKAVIRLAPLIEERNEKLKAEMMSKLKDLGNLVLKPFGLSTDNFQLQQDPETKGYSINFQQNK